MSDRVAMPVVNGLGAGSPLNVLDLDPHDLSQWLVNQGEKPYRASQIIQWVHRYGLDDFASMSNLSKSLRARLCHEACVKPPQIIHEHRSQDGTRKWLLQVTGGAIETVFIPDKDRGTLCVSSQVGCALNCQFCSTARQGFQRNLTLSEIIGQMWLAARSLSDDGIHRREITNVVFMGMGEPLLNVEAVIKAANLMMSDQGYGLSKYRVTVSTSGVVPALAQLKANSDVALAISLHAPDDALRDQLVPINKKYPIDVLLDACRDYFPDGKRQITIEYVMLKDVNDSEAQARLLAQRLRGIPNKVNLIPFNPFPGAPFECSSMTRIRRFQDVLMRAGLIATIRRTRGDDINAACGQLVGDFQDKTGRKERYLTRLAG